MLAIISGSTYSIMYATHTPHAIPSNESIYIRMNVAERHRRATTGIEHVRDGDEEQYRAPFTACFHVSIILADASVCYDNHRYLECVDKLATMADGTICATRGI